MGKSAIVRQLLEQSRFLAFSAEELKKLDQRYRSKKNVFVRFGYQWSDGQGSRRHLSIALRNRLRELFGEVSDSTGRSDYQLNYSSLRAQAGSPVMHRIIFDILSADLLFFDVTHINGNVFFELGVAYAANKNLFLLHEGIARKMPSDLAGLTYCNYSFHAEILIDSNSESDIKAAMKTILKNKIQASSRR